MSFRVLFVLILLIVSGHFATADTKHKISEAEVMGTLDMTIYYATQVKTYGEWIDKYTPSDEKSERRKLFKPVLKEPMPGMIRAGHDLMFYDSAAKKMQTLTVIRYGSADFYFFNGKDITRYPGQSLKEWASESFGMTTSENTSPLFNLLAPQAYAGLMGSSIGPVVASSAYDAALKNFPAPAVKSDVNPDELEHIAEQMVGKMLPSPKEAEEQIDWMKGSVLRAMQDGTDIQCVDKPGSQYSGAKFTMNIDGHDMNVVSQPQSDLGSLKIDLMDQTRKANKSEILFNQSTSEYRIVAQGKDGNNVYTGKQKEDSSDNDDILAHVASPWVKDDRPKVRDEKFTPSETKDIIAWLNKDGSEVGRNLRVCNAFMYRPRRGTRNGMLSGNEAKYYEITRSHRHSTILGRQVEDKVLDLNSKSIAAACAFWRTPPSGWDNPTMDKMTLYLSRSAFNCDRVEALVKPPIDEKDLTLDPDGKMSNVCRSRLLGAMQDKGSLKAAATRVKNNRDFNKNVRQIEQEFSIRVNNYFNALDISESATACCRHEPCRKEMLAARSGGEKQMSDKSGTAKEGKPE